MCSLLIKRPRMLDHQEQEAPVCWQIRQKHWNCTYRSSVSIRDTREPLQPWTLGASLGGVGWLTGTVSVGRKIEEGIGWREKEEMALLSFSSSIDRFGPLYPKGAKDQITKETDPFDDFGFKSFVDRFLEAMSLRVSWLPSCR